MKCVLVIDSQTEELWNKWIVGHHADWSQKSDSVWRTVFARYQQRDWRRIREWDRKHEEGKRGGKAYNTISVTNAIFTSFPYKLYSRSAIPLIARLQIWTICGFILFPEWAGINQIASPVLNNMIMFCQKGIDRCFVRCMISSQLGQNYLDLSPKFTCTRKQNRQVGRNQASYGRKQNVADGVRMDVRWDRVCLNSHD